MHAPKIVEEQGHYRVEGAITFATVTGLYRELEKCIDQTQNQTIVLDLSSVTEIDSAAIALFIAIEQRTQLTLLNAGHDINSLIKLYGVNWLTAHS